jgi:hypothetical protein
MKASNGFTISTIAAAIIGLAAASSAHAVPVIVNGGFEAGFVSWTRVDQLGGDGSFSVQSGTASPVNGDPVPAPPEGSNAAMTDAQGPGAHVLYQDFVVTAGGATLSFDLFIGNRADAFYIPPAPNAGNLDFALTSQTGSNTLNQQARVDILRASADPFSVAAGDVLVNLFRTNPGDPLVSGYNDFSFDVGLLFAAHVGETLRLRFAQTDNVNIFQMGVDNVRINVVPEPASTLLFGVGLVVLLAGRSGTRSRTVHNPGCAPPRA